MSIKETISQRGIEEILHFTTDKGITGILEGVQNSVSVN